MKFVNLMTLIQPVSELPAIDYESLNISKPDYDETEDEWAEVSFNYYYLKDEILDIMDFSTLKDGLVKNRCMVELCNGSKLHIKLSRLELVKLLEDVDTQNV